MKEVLEIDRVIRFSVNGKEFSSLEAAERYVLECKINEILALNFEGVSGYFINVLFNRIVDNRKRLIEALTEYDR